MTSRRALRLTLVPVLAAGVACDVPTGPIDELDALIELTGNWDYSARVVTTCRSFLTCPLNSRFVTIRHELAITGVTLGLTQAGGSLNGSRSAATRTDTPSLIPGCAPVDIPPFPGPMAHGPGSLAGEIRESGAVELAFEEGNSLGLGFHMGSVRGDDFMGGVVEVDPAAYSPHGLDCTIEATWQATRRGCYDVAVAVLAGYNETLGSGSSFPGQGPLVQMVRRSTRVNPILVTARGFRYPGVMAPPDSQLNEVNKWLAGLNATCAIVPRLVLVGHSLGGDAVRLASTATFPNLCWQIAIDPIRSDFAAIGVGVDQREFTPEVPVNGGSRFENFLSEGEDRCEGSCNVTKGYLVAGVVNDNEIMTGTDHCSFPCGVDGAVADSGRVEAAVMRCLEGR